MAKHLPFQPAHAPEEDGLAVDLGELLADLGEYFQYLIGQPMLSASDVCRYLVLNACKVFAPLAVFLAKLDDSGKIRGVGSFGFTDAQKALLQETHINDALPASDVIRNNELLWYTDRNELLQDYPSLIGYPLEKSVKSVIIFPIEFSGTPIGVGGIFGMKDVPLNSPYFSFLRTISGITGLHLSRFDEMKKSRSVEINPQIPSRVILSRRQNLILNLIREHLTNQEIAKELGFSESTIRQEAMRIYQILKVPNRRQAAAVRFKEDLDM